MDSGLEELNSSEELVEEASQVIEQVEQAWINEKFAPEILPNTGDAVDCILEQIRHIEDNIPKLNQKSIQRSLHQLEVDRLRFLICSLLRNRLEKIELFHDVILKAENQRIKMKSDTYLSENELKFLKDFKALNDQCSSETLKSFLGTHSIKRNPEEQQVVPNSHSFVFVQANEDIDGVRVLSEYINLKAGSIQVLPYYSISNFVISAECFRMRQLLELQRWVFTNKQSLDLSSRCRESFPIKNQNLSLTKFFEDLVERAKYTGYRDRPLEERKIRFQNACREGHTEIAFITTGTNLQLIFTPSIQNNPYAIGRQPECDFDKDPSKVSIKSSFIMNGVCVRFKGWLDLERLDGSGCLEFDEEQADAEDSLLRDQIDRYNQRLRDFENKQRLYSHNQIEIDGRMSNNSLQNLNTTGTASRCHNNETSTLHRQNLSMGISLTPPQ